MVANCMAQDPLATLMIRSTAVVSPLAWRFVGFIVSPTTTERPTFIALPGHTGEPSLMSHGP